MQKTSFIGGLLLLCVFLNCGGKTEKPTSIVSASKKGHFIGNYNKTFNDFNKLHMVAAIENGISPMRSRDDTLTLKNELQRIPDALELYKTYKLTHSVPFRSSYLRQPVYLSIYLLISEILFIIKICPFIDFI